MNLKALLLSSLLLLSSKASADYLGQITINGTEYAVGKSEEVVDGKKPVILDCGQKEIMELVCRTFIEEKREYLKNDTYRLYDDGEKLITGSYTDSRKDVNKANRIIRIVIPRLPIPKWTFAFDSLNPKLFVLGSIAEIQNSCANVFEKTEDIEGKTLDEYLTIYAKVNTMSKQVNATADFSEAVDKATEIPFIFTNDDIDAVKEDLNTWNAKSFELLAVDKLNQLKNINAIRKRKWKEIQKSPEYLAWLDKMSKAISREYLYKLISDKYEIKVISPELVKKDKFPAEMDYNSVSGAKVSETAGLEMKLEKFRINDNEFNTRIWFFADKWKEDARFEDNSFLKFPSSVLIIHPKDASVSGVVEKTYDGYSGGWSTNLAANKDEKAQLENKIKKYIGNEIISYALKGWIIKTKNVSEWIVWKMQTAQKESLEDKKAALMRQFEDYAITEIPIYQGQFSAKYLGFNISNANGNCYALINPRIEKGEISNLSWGELEILASLDKTYEENEYFIDKNKNEKSVSVARSTEFLNEAKKSIEDIEIESYLDNRKNNFFSANSGLKKYDIVNITKIGDDKAEIIIDKTTEMQNSLPISTVYEEREKLYIKKTEFNGKKIWQEDKTEKISVKSYNR
jgi:hypothetical protein